MEEKGKVLTEPYVLNKRTEIVFKYIEAYNEMNVEGMIADFADDIVFLNVMNGENPMELKGIEEFKKQAIDALSYFSAREQAIESMTHLHSSTEIVINYRAVAAKDFPNGLKNPY